MSLFLIELVNWSTARLAQSLSLHVFNRVAIRRIRLGNLLRLCKRVDVFSLTIHLDYTSYVATMMCDVTWWTTCVHLRRALCVCPLSRFVLAAIV